MLKEKDYQTKDVKPEAAKVENVGGLPHVADSPPMPKVEKAKKTEGGSEKTDTERLKALEAIVESAFVIRPDGTVKRLKKGINR